MFSCYALELHMHIIKDESHQEVLLIIFDYYEEFGFYFSCPNLGLKVLVLLTKSLNT